MDLSEMKAAQQTKSRLASIVQSSNDAIISVDLDAVIATWNSPHPSGWANIVLPSSQDEEEDRDEQKVRGLDHFDSHLW